MSQRIAIDTGGTFTDLVGIDTQTGAIFTHKTSSTPSHPEKAILTALLASGATPATVEMLLIGTTVATNVLLERSGARVFYLTTAGFEDILYIQRVNRKFHYDLTWRKPQPFARRADTVGVRERIDKDGNIVTPLDQSELARIWQQLEQRLEKLDHPAAIAVNFLFSYVNSRHEKMLGEFLATKLPNVPISLSHEVAPIWREYERGSTTVIDAYVKPTIERFVRHTESGLVERGFTNPVYVMKSNGGTMPSHLAQTHAVEVLLSGLAGGMIAGQYFGELAGSRNIISLDMGGTSTDVGTITDGKIGYTTEYNVEWGIPIAAPFMDLATIGAGGGSIAWIDKGGFLKVGPQSAGAAPGPICYGRGGTIPTVTDANLCLGRLNPTSLLGGQIQVEQGATLAQLGKFGAQLGMNREEIAWAIVELANENMANAIRLITVARGIDPRDYDLVAFGGAGPLHAAMIARAVGIGRILIPPHPGLGSAFGALLADLRVDKVWTQALRSDRLEASQVEEAFARLATQACTELQLAGHSGQPIIQRSIRMRYIGQNYEQEISVPPGPIDDQSLQAILEQFHYQHEAFYGYRFNDEVIQLVHFNLSAIGVVPKASLTVLHALPQPAANTRRQVCLHKDEGFIECPIYQRNMLGRDAQVRGPAIIEEQNSTVLLDHNQHLWVNEYGILIISV